MKSLRKKKKKKNQPNIIFFEFRIKSKSKLIEQRRSKISNNEFQFGEIIELNDIDENDENEFGAENPKKKIFVSIDKFFCFLSFKKKIKINFIMRWLKKLYQVLH